MTNLYERYLAVLGLELGLECQITNYCTNGPGLTQSVWLIMTQNKNTCYFLSCNATSLLLSISSWDISHRVPGAVSIRSVSTCWPEFDPHIWHILSWRFGHENILRPFFLFRWFKESSCQLLAKEWALNTGKLPRRLAQEQCDYGNWLHPKWPKMCWRAVKQKSNQTKLSHCKLDTSHRYNICNAFFKWGYINQSTYHAMWHHHYSPTLVGTSPTANSTPHVGITSVMPSSSEARYSSTVSYSQSFQLKFNQGKVLKLVRKN